MRTGRQTTNNPSCPSPPVRTSSSASELMSIHPQAPLRMRLNRSGWWPCRRVRIPGCPYHGSKRERLWLRQWPDRDRDNKGATPLIQAQVRLSEGLAADGFATPILYFSYFGDQRVMPGIAAPCCVSSASTHKLHAPQRSLYKNYRSLMKPWRNK